MVLGTDDWIQLDPAKVHLRIPVSDVTVDPKLSDTVQSAEEAVTTLIGRVKKPATDIVEYAWGGGRSIRVETWPVATITSVTVFGSTVAQADRDTGSDGWYLKSKNFGRIHHTSLFPSGWVKVTFKPGRDPIPANIQLAGLEMLRHLWKTQRGEIPRAGLMGEPLDESTVQIGSFAYPKRVIELLAPYRPGLYA